MSRCVRACNTRSQQHARSNSVDMPPEQVLQVWIIENAPPTSVLFVAGDEAWRLFIDPTCRCCGARTEIVRADLVTHLPSIAEGPSNRPDLIKARKVAIRFFVSFVRPSTSCEGNRLRFDSVVHPATDCRNRNDPRGWRRATQHNTSNLAKRHVTDGRTVSNPTRARRQGQKSFSVFLPIFDNLSKNRLPNSDTLSIIQKSIAGSANVLGKTQLLPSQESKHENIKQHPKPL